MWNYCFEICRFADSESMLGFERKSRLFGHLLPQEYLEINEKNILGDNPSDSLDTGRLSAFFASYKVRV